MSYAHLSHEELLAKQRELETAYKRLQEKHLSLNMARGKPSNEQLALSYKMLDVVTSETNLILEDGTHCANYGMSEGIPAARALMGEIMQHPYDQVLVMGNSSLNIMYDLIVSGMLLGYDGQRPWAQLDAIKWLCPVPGYDRHFRILETLGIEMIPTTMTEHGPDMDEVERLVATDENIKGIWCVPQYSNPTGITYSDETVLRLAAMKTAAPDFKIFWDNAYCVHHLYESNQDHVLNIAIACAQAETKNRYFAFASTSKVTLPGNGIAAVAASKRNIDLIAKRIGVETVGYDKINQLRHVLFLKDKQGVEALMMQHARIIAPKFELVINMLNEHLRDTGASWQVPKGGYFINFEGVFCTAKRTVELCKNAGVTLTDAGATWPYGNDPHDSNIRIAPTLPPIEELQDAMEVFVVCNKLATVETLLKTNA
ncbi:MAG: aminotransferase class I/II-fold pyridoxal phosphate-dependent enzyme [Eggerthellaceae bacterium]|nr:aminotransferase class I/II-fold pyridoxal phosphate-dependent enzyme [Eggerthellaceae bacterium]